MTGRNGESSGKLRVLDEEGEVDTEVKKSILAARDRVLESHYELFVGAIVDGNQQIHYEDLVASWGEVVEGFLMQIEPLLRAEEVYKSEEYYEKAELGEVTLYPPDVDDYPFRQLFEGGMSEEQFRIAHGIAEHVELPQPVTQEFTGLKSIIEADGRLTHTWTVETGSFSDPQSGGVVTPTCREVIPKHIYKTAVRQANQFLHDIGLTVDTGSPEREVNPTPI